MPPLSLDCLTLTDTAPAELIRSAGKAGFDLVSLWAQAPAPFPKQVLTRGENREIAAALAETGIRVHALEAFDMVSPEGVRSYRTALELGAELGAKAVLAIHRTNPDRAEVVEAFGCLAELAAELGLAINLEPIAMGHTRTLAEAHALIHDAGIDAGIIFDCYHFVRMGGKAADISGPARDLIRYVQVCDGPPHTPEPEWPMEAATERLYPGDGSFPLVELLSAVPRTVPWAIETPSLRRAHAGVSPEMQAREAFDAMTRLFSQPATHQ